MNEHLNPYNLGYSAQLRGGSLQMNPYDFKSARFSALKWQKGFAEAMDAEYNARVELPVYEVEEYADLEEYFI